MAEAPFAESGVEGLLPPSRRPAHSPGQTPAAKKAPLVEIIPGKGPAALKKHVLRFLNQKDIKALAVLA